MILNLHREVGLINKKNILIVLLIIIFIFTLFLTLHNLNININSHNISNSNNTLIKSDNIPKNKIININNATVDELDSIPGVGLVISNAIVVFREKNNGIKNIEELKNIPGIGEKRFDSIKSWVVIQ